MISKTWYFPFTFFNMRAYKIGRIQLGGRKLVVGKMVVSKWKAEKYCSWKISREQMGGRKLVIGKLVASKWEAEIWSSENWSSSYDDWGNVLYSSLKKYL